MNEPVKSEIAKLLREKGFKQPCFYYYDKNGKLNEPYLENGSSTDVEFRVDLTDLLEYHNSYSTQYSSAPTIVEVVMWLYETYGVWTQVVSKNTHKGMCFTYELKRFQWDGYITDITDGILYNSPTEAYEAAITYYLENLIQGGNNEQQ
jgi:hypothetical protein